MEICDRIPTESLVQILKDEGMPHYATVMRWLRAHESFRENYAHARESQGHYDADMMVAIREQAMRGELAPDVARVAMDSCKWTAARRFPKVYGDKIQHANDPDNPMPAPQFIIQPTAPRDE